MLSCPGKKLTGIDCPGCGMQRSVAAALRGDWGGSWEAYPPLGFVIVVFLLTTLHLIFKWKKGARLIQWAFAAAAAAVLLNYGYNIATGQVV